MTVDDIHLAIIKPVTNLGVPSPAGDCAIVSISTLLANNTEMARLQRENAKFSALWDAIEKLTDWAGGTDHETHIVLGHDHVGMAYAHAMNGETTVATARAGFDGQPALIALAEKLETDNSRHDH